jgi:nitroreductase
MSETPLSLHDAIYTLRAMRRLKPDPVPEEDLRYVVDAATQAASGENQQGWAFVVVRDPEVRRRIGEIYARLAEGGIPELIKSAPDEDEARVYHNALRFAGRFGEVPAMIVCCHKGAHPTGQSATQQATWYGSILPAVQNLMLAARARGLGTVLTTMHIFSEKEVKEALGMPDDYSTVAIIPIGYPEGEWKQPVRRAAAEVTHWDRWGQHR